MTAEPATTGHSGDNPRRILRMSSHVWAVADTTHPEGKPGRITFHYSADAAQRHYETGHAR